MSTPAPSISPKRKWSVRVGTALRRTSKLFSSSKHVSTPSGSGSEKEKDKERDSDSLSRRSTSRFSIISIPTTPVQAHLASPKVITEKPQIRQQDIPTHISSTFTQPNQSSPSTATVAQAAKQVDGPIAASRERSPSPSPPIPVPAVEKVEVTAESHKPIEAPINTVSRPSVDQSISENIKSEPTMPTVERHHISETKSVSESEEKHERSRVEHLHRAITPTRVVRFSEIDDDDEEDDDSSPEQSISHTSPPIVPAHLSNLTIPAQREFDGPASALQSTTAEIAIVAPTPITAVSEPELDGVSHPSSQRQIDVQPSAETTDLDIASAAETTQVERSIVIEAEAEAPKPVDNIWEQSTSPIESFVVLSPVSAGAEAVEDKELPGAWQEEEEQEEEEVQSSAPLAHTEAEKTHQEPVAQISAAVMPASYEPPPYAGLEFEPPSYAAERKRHRTRSNSLPGRPNSHLLDPKPAAPMAIQVSRSVSDNPSAPQGPIHPLSQTSLPDIPAMFPSAAETSTQPQPQPQGREELTTTMLRTAKLIKDSLQETVEENVTWVVVGGLGVLTGVAASLLSPLV